MRLTGEGQLAEFIEGLGPGQLVGRQVLGAPSLGDIQLSLCHQRGVLEVEIIRARGLQARPGSKVLPGMFLSPVKLFFTNIPLLLQPLMLKYIWYAVKSVMQKLKHNKPGAL